MSNPVRQYVGARYTVQTYENSQDPSSAEWESGRSWEPLILVTYNNSSYMSKKEVPSSIGNPADNPAYWVCTGYYNGQILSLQNQIDQINNVDIPAIISDVNDNADDISNINTRLNRKIIVVTDSYGTVQSGLFGTALAAKLSKTLDADLIFLAQGSSGFIGISPAPTFLSQLQTYEGNHTFDKSEVTDVICLGGTNDRAHTKVDIQSAIVAFNSHVRSNYPNAQMHIGFISRSTQAGFMYQIRNNVLEAYIDSALYAPKCGYISGSQTWLPYDYIDADTLHPTSAGCQILAWCLGNYISGQTTDGFSFNQSETISFDQTDINPSMSSTLSVERHGDDIDVVISPMLLQLFNMVGNSFQNGLKIASTTQDFVNAVSYDVGSISCVVMARIKDANNVETWHYCDARLKLTLDGIYLKFNAPFEMSSLTMNAIYFINGISASLNPFNC